MNKKRSSLSSESYNIEPYCFIFTEKNKALIFNTLSSSKIEVVISKNLKKIIMELKDSKNMYCVEIDEKDLEDTYLREFINNLKINFSGDIVDTPFSKIKPIVMYPELNLQV
jgi:pseudo-rSAM protein